MGLIDSKLEKEKNILANNIFVLFAALFTMVIASSLYRSTNIGWHPMLIWDIAVTLPVYLLALYRKHIPFKAKALILIFTPYLFAIVGLLFFGIVGHNSYLWIFAPLIATVIFNVRFAVILVLLGSVIILTVGILASRGLWTFQFSPGDYLYSLSSWLMQTSAYLCFAGVSVMIAGKMNHIIHSNLQLVEQQRKELAVSNATKDKLFSVIAHDLRAPFHSIMVLLEMLSEEDGDITEEERKEFFQKMLKNSKCTYSMLENLLTWSRSQIGALEIEKKKTNLHTLTSVCTTPYLCYSENKNIKIIQNVPEELEIFVDEPSIRIVISNLLSNAIKFTPQGGTITITGQNDKANTIICIADTGVGISEDNLERLFDDTDHITTFGTENEKGTGLGLGLCYNLVKRNSGNIWVEKNETTGTVFNVSLPKE